MKARTLVAMTAPLLWNNRLLPRLALDRRGRTIVNALAATGYALVFDGRPNWTSARGLRYGTAYAAVVATGCVAALLIHPVRRALGDSGDRATDVRTVEWVAVHIPFGTVYAEELIFRATLNPLLNREFGPRAGSAAGAVVFGLWHVHPARAAGDDIVGTVAFTGLSGLLFAVLNRHAGSATAPALLHWAVNAGGALLPRLAPLLPAVREAGTRAGSTSRRSTV